MKMLATPKIRQAYIRTLTTSHQDFDWCSQMEPSCSGALSLKQQLPAGGETVLLIAVTAQHIGSCCTENFTAPPAVISVRTGVTSVTGSLPGTLRVSDLYTTGWRGKHTPDGLTCSMVVKGVGIAGVTSPPVRYCCWDDPYKAPWLPCTYNTY